MIKIQPKKIETLGFSVDAPKQRLRFAPRTQVHQPKRDRKPRTQKNKDW